MAQARSVPFPLLRSTSSPDSSPYNSSHSASQSSLFLSLDISDSEHEDDFLASSHSLASIDSGYFSAMGKDSPSSKYSKRKTSKTDLRFPLAPINSATDITQESPKREGTLRSLLRKKKKSLCTPLPNDVDPFALPFPPPLPTDVEPIPHSGIFPLSSPRSNSYDASGEVFERKDRFVLRRGMKHHPYSHDDAPYMQAYDRPLLDNDRFSEILLRRLNPNQSPSFHDFSHTPPKTILDLGCGAGGWAVQAAEFWPSSHVIGFDLLDPVRLRGGAESPSNVQWKQGNFVKYKLPFPKNMFDLVRMADLSLCIPYERWEHVLSEARRVLAQRGRLELIDDYLYFPYTKRTPLPSAVSHDLPRSQQSSSAFHVGDDDEVDDDDESSEKGDLETDDEDDDFVSTKSRLSTIDLDDFPFPPVHDPISDWNHNIDNSKSMETLFEEMLSQNFSIHPRPSKFIDQMVDKVFGRYNQAKLHEFNLYLAPASSKDSDESSVASSESQGSAGLKKAGKDFAKWMTTVEWDHAKEKEKKPRKSGDRPSGEDSLNLSMVPGTISAKAAGRLGITAPSPAPPPAPSHSHPAQSPGLILWPSTFIPIAPLELEMHACKHLHTLIGCKAALMEFIEDIARQRNLPFDERLVDDLLWDYESFRRKRFNWPSDCPDFETPINASTPRSTSFRHSSESNTPTQERPHGGSFGSMSPPPDPLFPREKLDFVRSIRVYSATKFDEEIHVS